MSSGEALVRVRDAVKTYQALRPLRIQDLTIGRGDIVSLMGLDAAGAEMLVGLLTGAVLPDAGDIHLFGQSTRDVADSDAWLAMLDGVGIMTDRAVLIAQFSVEQNIALPFTLAIDPVADDLRPRVAGLAAEVGLTDEDLSSRVAEARPEVQVRVRLARALALQPSLLLVEHPSATLPRELVTAFAADLARVARRRALAVLALTADAAFASGLGGQILTHEPATGAVHPPTMWRKLFKRF
jgi:phospholipid/cholesterol/gamma-HCH transport system ATP-binding protein